jgi:large repetitive protein
MCRLILNMTVGEGLLVAAKDTLPNVLASATFPTASSAGRKMQKLGEEYFLMLPPPGASNILAGTYYLAVAGEGVSPQAGRIGAGTSSFTLTSRGVAPVRNLGQLGFSDLVESNSIPGGDTQIYQFTVPAGTLAMEARLENQIGNPVMVLRLGSAFPDSGAGLGAIPSDGYGHENGEVTGNFVHNSFINVANPTNPVCTLIVMARAVAPGVYSNASYTLRLNASGSTTLDFDNNPVAVTNHAAQTWKYFRVVVPTNALGWDVRLLNVAGGTPRMVIRRESLPNALATTPWNSPSSSSSWATNAQWAPVLDWTRRSQSAADATIVEDGRVFAVGMGRPLEPGTYFVGVFNNSTTASSSYTILSRGIGAGFSIPVVDVPFVGSAGATLPGREAAYFRVYVPSNTTSWKIKLTGVAGESMLVALRNFVPNIDLNVPNGTLAGGKGMQKAGNEHFVLLPATGQTNITAGTYYFAVVSEGVNPPNIARIGAGSSSFTFESEGTLATNHLGLLTSEDILYPDTVEGGEVKLYQFAVPSGMLGFKVRLENRVGNPTFVFRLGDKTPDPGAAVPTGDTYGTEGGYTSTDGHSTLYTVPNPAPGIYTLVVKGRPLGFSYTDATYTLRLQEMLVPELNFSASLNTNGLANSVSGVLEDNERIFYKFVIPATLDGQPVIGWKLNLVQSSGVASMRVRKDILPSDVNAINQMPFATAQAIVVPAVLTNGTWYVEVKGAGSTAFTLTSSALTLERPAWVMPAPGESNQTPGVVPPLFGDTAIDTNGVAFPEPSTFLEQGFLHYYAVAIPDGNEGLFRAALEAVSGNPDLYLRYGAPATLYHSALGTAGTIYDRSMLALTTEYANWIPLDGKVEAQLRPGLWYMAVRASGNANARYRLKLSVGTITDVELNNPELSNQLVAAGDWRYYRFTAPTSLPVGFNLSFSQQSGDVLVHLRDTVPPGTGLHALDFRDWTSDVKNNGPYGSFDAPGTHSFSVPPVRPGAVYYLGVRALSDAVFTIRATTNGAPAVQFETIPFYGGVVVTNLPPGGHALYRIDVPAEATRWKHAATHATGMYVALEQGTMPRPGSEDWRNNPAVANSSLNQYLLTAWPWVAAQSYFLVISNSTAQVQDVVFAMDGKNAATDDNDADALADAWELQYFGNTTSQSSAGDPDRDGVTNYDEFFEGTNPTDAGSFQARLTTAAMNGSILRSPDAPVYPLNTPVTLTASPAPGYAFIGWTGNASGRQNPLAITMDGHKAIGATFKAAGDDFITALPLLGTSATALATNVGMSKEPGEPNHAGNPGGKSMWWNWNAPASGSVTLTTAGSAFNTLLAVYTGSSVSTLNWVASDNNSGGTTNRSIVQFSAVAGTTYHIAVDGYNGASSRINLSLTLGNTSGLRPDLRSIARFGDGRAEFVLVADPSRTYTVETSTNLVNWSFLGTVTTDAAGSGRFTDAEAASFNHRFYRARQ